MPAKTPVKPSAERLKGLLLNNLPLPSGAKAKIKEDGAVWGLHAGPVWGGGIDTLIQTVLHASKRQDEEDRLVHLGAGSALNLVRLSGRNISVQPSAPAKEEAESGPILVGDEIERYRVEEERRKAEEIRRREVGEAEPREANKHTLLRDKAIRPGLKVIVAPPDQTGLPSESADCVIVEIPRIRGPIPSIMDEAARLVRPGGSIITLRAHSLQTGDDRIDGVFGRMLSLVGEEPAPVSLQGLEDVRTAGLDLLAYEKVDLTLLYDRLESEPRFQALRASALSPLNDYWYTIRRYWGGAHKQMAIRWRMDISLTKVA